MGKKKEKHGQRLQRYGANRDTLMRYNSLADCKEYEVVIERLAGGASLEAEAERLGLTIGSLSMFFSRGDAEIRDAYRDALEARAEAIHDFQYKHARSMVDNAGSLERDHITALDKGLSHLEALKRSDGPRHRPNSKNTISLTPDNLKDFLASMDSERRKKAIEDQTIEAEYVDITPQDDAGEA